MLHCHICDIRTPNLVGPVYQQITQKIRHAVFHPTALTEALHRIDCSQIHQVHQASREFLANLVALAAKEIYHLTNTHSGTLCKLLVYNRHDLKVPLLASLTKTLSGRFLP